MAQWGAWARAQSAAGNKVTLLIDPGFYIFDLSMCPYALANIADLHIKGYGATLQNISSINNGAANPWFQAGQPLRDGTVNNVYQYFLIQTTTPNTTTFRMRTPSQAENLTVGQYVMLSSVYIQQGGYPPNCDRFEYLIVTAINTTTGVITVDRPIRYMHPSTYPDDLTSPCFGAARVWLTTTAGWGATFSVMELSGLWIL